MQLYEKGLIDIDKDVRTYVPIFPEKKWRFTVRQLLNHTSGIRNYKEGEFNSKNFYTSTSEAIKVFAYDSLNYEPGTKYEYTTLGYSLLAAIIENVTKTSFESYLVNNIFVPADMQNTFVDKQKLIISNRVRGYEKNFAREFVNAPLADLSIKVAGGGLLSNSRDLLLFSKALLEGRLIKKSTFELMCTPSKLKSGKKLEYGLGFSVKVENDTLKAIYHYGSGTGFSSLLYINPLYNIVAVDLINIVDRNLNAPAEDLAKIELDNKYITPLKTLSDNLMILYKSFGIDSTLNKFNEIADSNAASYNLSEIELTSFSTDLIGLSKTKDAIIYLRGLLKRYPKSFNIIVSIADAYLKDKNEGLALKYYRTAQQLNNNDAYVKRMINKLNKMN
jgi:CubicO group peptidase (beta-lactamase class C family)